MAPKSHSLQILVTQRQKDQIQDLATLTGLSMGGTIRQLVETAYNHRVMGVPTCPDGQRCFVPQMHHAPIPMAGPRPPEGQISS